jgi:hypothetical protein
VSEVRKRDTGEFPQWIGWAAACVALLASRPFLNAATNQYGELDQVIGFVGLFAISIVSMAMWSAVGKLQERISTLKQAPFEKETLIRELEKNQENQLLVEIAELKKRAQDAEKVAAFWENHAMAMTTPPDPNQKTLL